MSDEKKEPKAGYKTTEFWLSTAAMLVGLFLASGVTGEDSQAMKIAGLAAAALGALGYTVSRGAAKKAAKLIVVVILLGAVAGCCTGHIKASEVKDTWGYVSSTHDQFIDKGTVTMKDANGNDVEKKPGELSELEKRVLKRNTATFQKTMDAALEE